MSIDIEDLDVDLRVRSLRQQENEPSARIQSHFNKRKTTLSDVFFVRTHIS